MRKCYVCSETKELELFTSQPKEPFGRGYMCKLCNNARFRKMTKESRLEVLNHYSLNPEKPECACCQEDKLEFLALDHINGGGGKHKKGISGSAYYWRWFKRNEWPEGFRVLCHNCNMALGVHGYCPHGKLESRSVV